MAKVAVYDKNVRALQKACKPDKTTPAQIEMWDIAGLIKGASEGAGKLIVDYNLKFINMLLPIFLMI